MVKRMKNSESEVNASRNVRPDPKEQNSAGVIAPPPLIYAASILVGLLLDYVWPLRIPISQTWITTLVGVSLMVLGGLLAVAGSLALRRAGTPVSPYEATSDIVRTGPYRFSRNPLYVALSLLQVGVGIWVNNVWVVAMLIPGLVVMSWGVVAREEAYLAHGFGEEYLEYKSSVRRWL